MISILLVDDHGLFRDTMRAYLSGQEGISVAAEVATGEAAIDYVRATPPQIVLMDVNMPGIGGIEATRRIARMQCPTKIIAVTALSDDPIPSQLIDAGARGFVSKGSAGEELIEAIKTVSRGGHFLSAEVARKLSLMQFKKNGHPSILSLLTLREMQILMMIVRGVENAVIADSLFLSPKTISTYRRRLYDKLEVSNDVQLTHFAYRHRLIAPLEPLPIRS
jgi:two-component system invasion response regulator UvrY